ncbi:MAG TPA: serine/threonine-protein kinase [Gemmatimonadales bacterium]|nr:serine/threonine-protein kinase [Gemmatimonadales bacterium]
MPHLQDRLAASLSGAYVLERELGGGGMSRVFLAHETSLGRKVVIKVLLPELVAGVSVERFRREIQLTARLQHPHIVPVHSTGELAPEAGAGAALPYYTMPFVEGESLRARLARDGELPVAETIRLLRGVASALAYAHAQGVVHRDIKPDNVLLSTGVAVVTDFGVAKALTASAGDATGLTSMGLALGTPTYMAPEQASADPSMDHRVDIYAFGIMGYEMLAGQPPFVGRSPQAILAAQVTETPDPITRVRPAVPPQLGALLMRCLEKRAADRPQSAAELMNALDAIATPSGGMLPTQATPAAERRLLRERTGQAEPTLTLTRRASFAVLTVAVAALGALVYAWLRPDDLTRGRESSARDVGIAAPPVQPPAAAPSTPSAGPAAGPAAAPPVAARRDSATPPPSAARARPPESRAAPRAAAPARPRRAEPVPESVAAGAGAAVPVTPPAAPRESLAARDTTRAAPPTPPRAAAPPPTSAPVAAPPADPAPAIRAVIADYASAIEAHSIAALRRVYPNLTAQQQQEWEQFFQGVRDVEATLAVTRLTAAGDSAEADVAGQYLYDNPSTHRRERQAVSFHALLRRVEGGWRITGIR